MLFSPGNRRTHPSPLQCLKRNLVLRLLVVQHKMGRICSSQTTFSLWTCNLQPRPKLSSKGLATLQPGAYGKRGTRSSCKTFNGEHLGFSRIFRYSPTYGTTVGLRNLIFCGPNGCLPLSIVSWYLKVNFVLWQVKLGVVRPESKPSSVTFFLCTITLCRLKKKAREVHMICGADLQKWTT